MVGLAMREIAGAVEGNADADESTRSQTPLWFDAPAECGCDCWLGVGGGECASPVYCHSADRVTAARFADSGVVFGFHRFRARILGMVAEYAPGACAQSCARRCGRSGLPGFRRLDIG